jgi:hypothetical protein
MRFEYKIVPAPAKVQKNKGIKTPEDRFAHTLEEVLNEMAAEGWEYQRAETLPSQERAGLTSTVTEWRNVLVFRKTVEDMAVQSPVTPQPAVAAEVVPDIDDTALRADAPASITPDDDDDAKTPETVSEGKAPAFLSTPGTSDDAATSQGGSDAQSDEKPKT